MTLFQKYTLRVSLKPVLIVLAIGYVLLPFFLSFNYDAAAIARMCGGLMVVGLAGSLFLNVHNQKVLIGALMHLIAANIILMMTFLQVLPLGFPTAFIILAVLCGMWGLAELGEWFDSKQSKEKAVAKVSVEVIHTVSS